MLTTVLATERQSLRSNVQGPTQRVRVLRHKSNRGAQAARNTGAQAARGRWLTFLDSDDTLLRKSLELRLEVATTEDVDVVHSDGYVLRKGSPRRLFNVPKLRGSIYRELLANPGPMFQGMLISARSFQAIGGLDERVIAYQEWDTAIRLAKICSFGFVAKPTFNYDCTGDDTISKNFFPRRGAMSTLCGSISQKSSGVWGRNVFRFTTAQLQIIILKLVISPPLVNSN